MEITTEKIWSDYHQRLKRFALARVKDEDVSNDIIQDVMIKIHLNLDKLENKERTEQWVYQITRNAINDHFRKKKARISTDEIDLVEEISDPKNSFQFGNCITSFIKNLPHKYKEAITLVDLNNLSQLKLAEKLNISYSGAKSRVQRARDLLKANFTKCCHVSTDKYGNIISFKTKSTCTTCQI